MLSKEFIKSLSISKTLYKLTLKIINDSIEYGHADILVIELSFNFNKFDNATSKFTIINVYEQLILSSPVYLNYIFGN